MVLGLVVVDFVDGDGGVYDGRLDGFLLDDRLDSLKDGSTLFQKLCRVFTDLMYVVVDVLSSNHWCHRVCLLSTTLYPCILELSTLLFETCFNGLFITVTVLPMLDGNNVVHVLFGKDFAVFDWLDRGMIMVLVYLTVDGGLSFLMANLCDFLVHNGRRHFLVDSSVMVTSLVPNEVIALVKLNFRDVESTTLGSRDQLRV